MRKLIKYIASMATAVGVTWAFLERTGDTRQAVCALAGMITLFVLLRDE